MQFKNIKNVFWVVAVLALLALPKFFCNKSGSTDSDKKAAPKGMPIKVKVHVAKSAALNRIMQVSGTLLANEQVDIVPELQGLVTGVFFEEGSWVNKGSLLIKINDADYQAQLKKALANKKLKDENARRNEVLLKKEAISIADYDLSVSELNSVDADIDFLKEQIRKTSIKAPFSGRIGLRNISAGAYVTSGKIITTLQDAKKLKLDFSVPEKFALQVQKGDKVQFTIDDNDKIYEATVYAIDAVVSDETRSIKMRAIFNNVADELMPGLFAHVKVNTGKGTHAIVVPTQSIVPVLKGQKVFVVKADSVIERSVKTGYRTQTGIEILSGINEGDSVVTDGIMYMKKGVRVKVIQSAQ